MTDSPIVQALLARSMPPGGPRPSADALMWQFLTGGHAGNKVTVQRDPQIGTQIMTGPQTMELARAGLASASKGQLFGR